MSPFLYPLALALISLLAIGLEAVFPWRKDQRQLRPGLGSDVLNLVFNGHFLGVILYGLFARYINPPLSEGLQSWGLYAITHAGIAGDWPLWVQIPVLLFGLDFVQWCVHLSLHRVPGLWTFHQTHHSVRDGEMDWIVSFRFQWTEVVVYRAAQYLPLAFLGFTAEAIMAHAIFGTLVGHLNHANVDLGRGAWTYLLNNPRMHIWHHDRARDGRNTVNYGIIFSLWDWLFGTAYLPSHAPDRIGYVGDDRHPRDFFGQVAWPLSRWLPDRPMSRVFVSTLGLALVVVGYFSSR